MIVTGRKLLALLGAMALIVGIFGALVTPAAAQGTPCPEPTDAELEQIVQRWVDAYSTRDSALLASISSPDIVHGSVSHGTVSGIEAVLASQEALFAAFSDVTLIADLVLLDAPSAALAWTMTGTQTGPFNDFPPSGKSATWNGVSFLTIECGQIVRSWVFPDQITRLEQIGAMPAASAEAQAAAPAAASPDASPAACPTATDEEMAALLETWWGDGWSGDVSALEAIAADDVIHHWAVGPDTVGAAAQTERLAGWATSMPDMTYTWGDIVIDGEYAAAVWEGTGTATGEYQGTPGSGKTATWGGLNIFRIECGKIAEVWSEMDALSFRAQLAPDEAATPAP